MTKIKIVSRWDAERVLFECEVPADVASGLALRHVLEQVAASGSDLRDANLRGSDLRDANLSGSEPVVAASHAKAASSTTCLAGLRWAR